MSDDPTMDSNGSNRKSGWLCQHHTVAVERVHNFLGDRIFAPLFCQVAKRPLTVIAIVVFISIASAVVALATDSMQFESDANYLVPDNSYPVLQKEWVENTFITSRPTYIIVHASGENVATGEGIERLWQAEDRLWQVMRTFQAKVEGGLCGADPGGCELFSPTKFWSSQQDFQTAWTSKGDVGIRESLSLSEFADGTYVQQNMIYGKADFDSAGIIQSAKSFRSTLLLGNLFEAANFWIELELSSAIYDLNEEWSASRSNYRVAVFNVFSTEREAEDTLEQDTPLVGAAITIMAVFASIALTRCGKNSKGQWLVNSHGLLGLGATITVVLSMITGFSLCALTGRPVTGLCQALPFILIGIGMDDAFILIGCFDQTDNSLDIRERLRITGKVAGPSIFTTSLTDLCAFGLGSLFSSIPTVKFACFFAAVSILIDFIYQVTIFMAILVLDQRRLNDARRDCFVCSRATERDNDHDEIEELEEENRKWTIKKAMHTYTRVLLRPWTKAIVLVVFCVVLVFGAIGAARVQVDFDIANLLAEDSRYREYKDADTQYFGSSEAGLQSSVFVQDINIADPDVQVSLDKFLVELYEAGLITSIPKTSWLDSFKLFLESTPANSNLTSLSFEEQLDSFLSIDLVSRYYGKDIVRTNGAVTASRIWVGLKVNELSSASDQVALFVKQRQIALQQSVNQRGRTEKGIIPMFLYSEHFRFYDHFRRLKGELVTSLLISTLVVALISALFLPHIIGPLLSVLVIAAVNVELVGVVYFAGLNVDTLSLFILIISIGLTVDYCMHVLHSYLHNLHLAFDSKDERVEYTLAEIGASVFFGGFSTFLGSLALAFAKNVAFQTIFVLFVSMTVLGLGHGLILIPVVLSLLGPNGESGNDKRKRKVTARTENDLSFASTGGTTTSVQPPSADQIPPKHPPQDHFLYYYLKRQSRRSLSPLRDPSPRKQTDPPEEVF